MKVAPREVARNGKTTMLLKQLAKLSQEEQLKIHHHLGRKLRKRLEKAHVYGEARSGEGNFFRTEFGRYILEEANSEISIARVRRELAHLPGSLAHEIIQEREER